MQVRLPDELRAYLEALADRTGTTAAALIREAVEAWIAADVSRELQRRAEISRLIEGDDLEEAYRLSRSQRPD